MRLLKEPVDFKLVTQSKLSDGTPIKMEQLIGYWKTLGAKAGVLMVLQK